MYTEDSFCRFVLEQQPTCLLDQHKRAKAISPKPQISCTKNDGKDVAIKVYVFLIDLNVFGVNKSHSKWVNMAENNGDAAYEAF